MKFPRAPLAESGTISFQHLKDLLNRLKYGFFTGYLVLRPIVQYNTSADIIELYLVYVRGLCECALGMANHREIMGTGVINMLHIGGATFNYEIHPYDKAHLIVSLFPEAKVSFDPEFLTQYYHAAIAPEKIQYQVQRPPQMPQYLYRVPWQSMGGGNIGSTTTPSIQEPQMVAGDLIAEKERILREKLAMKRQLEMELASIENDLRQRMTPDYYSNETGQTRPPVTTPSVTQPEATLQIDLDRVAQMQRELEELEREIEKRKRMLDQITTEEKVPERVSETKGQVMEKQPAPTQPISKRVPITEKNRQEILSRDEVIRQRTLAIKQRIEEELKRKRGIKSTPSEKMEVPSSVEKAVEPPVEGRDDQRPRRSIFDELIEMNKELRK